jgi:DNA-binding transcriptional MerR regulator
MKDIAELPPEKLYFSIGEVAEMLAINQSNIRYWEKEFDFLQPKKNKKGNRMYTRKDLENVRLIFHLTKEKGYTIEGAKKVLSDKRAEAEKVAEVSARLKRIRAELIALKDSI